MVYRHPDLTTPRKRILGRSLITCLLVVASLIWGITGA